MLMDPQATESLPNIAQFFKIKVLIAELPEVGPRSVVQHCGGLIGHRMPLHRKLSPFLFGFLVGCVFGLTLTSDCFQMVFRRQIKLGDALICRHSGILYRGTTVAGQS